MSSYLDSQSLPQRLFRLVVTGVFLFLLFQFVTLYLSWPKQIVLGGVSLLVAMVLNRASRSKVVTLTLMIFSLAATFRYGWWRVHMVVNFFSDESNHRFTIDAFLMMVLLSAEAYTILIMILGFMQTSHPLHRKPIPLPSDEDRWPHVDVLIPTYNEPLSLVRYTALAAINIDYPPEKLHVYILDDGTRDDFREFCEQAGVGYVVRPEHQHAKAGNINHALKRINSPLVTIFDCDHVPTRSFLQVTVGWFLADQKLAMLQTPHFFYSPDPFERNLLQYKTIPNEGELFYGVIQDGNDLWNATFFCGSCAVMRRSALDEVGGIATETVTEDAHTSLRMQKKGWGTAYINLPQAAGLATETLSAHVGQRIRWARGMIQIFRTDNPMLASGMKFTQRLCYFNAMLHFLYAVPRLIFLCAPLVYMLGNRTIIPGYWVAILAYALPHLVLSSLTNSRVQGRHRHSFWNEIYETVLAPYILMPTLLALINPKLGKFNVTDKGSTLAETRFDRSIAAPTTWLLALNLIGVCVVPYRLLVTDPTHIGTVLSNLVWILFNMVVLGVAAAVANEQQQRRTSVRIPARLAVRLQFEKEGSAAPRIIDGMTNDMSVGGTSLSVPEGVQLNGETPVLVSFPVQTGNAQVPASVVDQYGRSVRLRFDSLTIAQEETLTCALYSRADSWISSRDKIEVDRPLISLGRVIRLSFTGFNQVLHGLLPEKKARIDNNTKINTDTKARAVATVLLLAALTLNQTMRGEQVPGAIAQNNVAVPLGTSSLLTEAEASDMVTLKDMGIDRAIEMRGPHSFYSVGFVLSNSRIPRRGQINLTYHFSPEALAPNTSIDVRLNNTTIGHIVAPGKPQQTGEYGFVTFPVPAELLIRSNQLTFEFIGGGRPQSDGQDRAPALALIGASSTVLVVGDRVAMKRDLSLLPLPLFDADLQTATTIPFVFLKPPDPRTLQAAAVVASWLGTLQSAQPIRFSVSVGAIPPGNVIVFSNHSADLPSELGIPQGSASLNLKSNPSDPDGTALVLAGDDDDQLLTAARSLALFKTTPPQPGVAVPELGDSARIGAFDLPPMRKPDDAPRWLSTGNLRSLAVDNSAASLRSTGSRSIPIYFRLPPDIYYGENQNLDLGLSYRYNALPVAQGSAMRVFINGVLVNDAPLPPGTDFADRKRAILLPVERLRPFGNTLLVNFDFVPANPSGNLDPAQTLQGEVLRNTALDIRNLPHWAAMPNLELFANAGFPFTRLADLSATTIVMPAAPNPKEITLLLYLMSHFGSQTGYPSLRVEVDGPDAAMRVGRDYLMLGNIADQPAFSSIESALPVTLDSDGVHVKQTSYAFSGVQALWRRLTNQTTDDQMPNNVDGLPDMIIEGVESPTFPGRSIVVLALREDDAVDTFTNVFLERSQSSDIQQTVSLLRGSAFQSYAVPTSTYHVGYISNYALMRLWLAQKFWLLLLVVTAFCFLIAVWTRDYLAFVATGRLRAEGTPL